MLTTLASLVTIVYLPGAAIFRLPVADRGRRAALPAEERVFWAVMLSIIVSTTTALILAAMSVYSLKRLVVWNVMLAVVLMAISFRRRRLGASSPRPGWTAAFPLALILIGGWMYFAVPASEWILGGRDPGVYVNQGIQIAQRESLVTRDEVASSVPSSMRDLFFPFSGDPEYYSLRYMGFLLRDPDAGIVTGQFPQGYPIWVAIAYGLDGLTGTRRVMAWWGILGVLAVYFAGKHLIGSVPAFAAAALLAVNVIQTWYARSPNSEMMTQALLFSGLTAHAYAHENDDRFFGPVAASLLGLAIFTRFPAILAIGVAAAASLLAPVNGRRVRAGFLGTLCIWLAAAGVYYLTQLRPYFSRPIGFVQNLTPAAVAALAAGVAATCVLLWMIRTPRVAAATRRALPLALIAITVGGGVYTLYFREPGGLLAPQDAYATRVFVYLYFTWLAFGLALLGYALVVWRSFWRAPALILALTTLTVFFLYKMRIWPEHFWLARRFLDVILPGGLLFAAAGALLPLSSIFSRPWASSRGLEAARLIAGVAAMIVLAQHYVAASGPIRTHIEYAGLIPRLEQLAGRFGDADLVVFEAREASDVHVLALPLSYIYARNVLVLHTSRPDKAAVQTFLEWAQKKYANVYFVAGGGTDLLSPGIGAEVVESIRFQSPEYQQTKYDEYPRSSQLKPFDFTIYRLVETQGVAMPSSMDIGGADDLYVLNFHPKERLGGGPVTFRWTQDVSYLLLKVAPSSRELVLRLSGGRPQGVEAATVSVSLDGHELGSAHPGAEFQDYTFRISDGVAEEAARRNERPEIRIETTTWHPMTVLGNRDDRHLGAMLDRAEIR